MTTESENKPLLIRTNPSWSRRSHRTAFPSLAGTSNSIHRSHSNLQQTESEDLSRSNPTVQTRRTTSYNPLRVRSALAAILITVVLERLTFYGFTGNLVLFLNGDPLAWESYYAMNALLVFFGISYIMSLIGGWIADSFLGRFRTLLLAYIVYICGFSLLPFLSENSFSVNSTLPQICATGENSTRHKGEGDNAVNSPFEENCAWLIFTCLIVIAIGAGTYKANICPFGSDQLSQASQHTQLSFFNWFYWCINMGSILGLGILTYVEQMEGFFYGYLACLIILCCSTLIFLLGGCLYVSRPADGSVLSNIFRIVREAWQRKRQKRLLLQMQRNSLPKRHPGQVDSVVEEKLSFLDYAKIQHGGIFHNSLVDDVKKLGIILLVFAVLIPYWIVYFQIVAAWFTLFDALFVIILLPLFDRIIYPRMAQAGYPFTFSKRIILGMVFAMAAMFVAGVVEHFRLQALWPLPKYPCYNESIAQKIGPNTYYAANMSVLWQIPQYALIGMSEVFGSVACLQFAVSVAPKSMKAIITGLFYLFSGVGSLLGVAIVTILASSQTWLFSQDAGNINCRFPCQSIMSTPSHQCHLDYYFYFLGTLEFLALILFVFVLKVFRVSADDLLLLHPKPREEMDNGIGRTS